MKYKCISFTHFERLSCALSSVSRCMRTGTGQCRPCDQQGSRRPSTAPTPREQQGKAAALARQRHRHCVFLPQPVHYTPHAPHLGMRPGLELKEVQVPPTAAHPVMDRLMLASALGKRGTTAGPYRLKVNRPLAVLRSLLATCRSRCKPSSVLKGPRSHSPSGARLPSETGGFTNESHALLRGHPPLRAARGQAFKLFHEIL